MRSSLEILSFYPARSIEWPCRLRQNSSAVCKRKLMDKVYVEKRDEGYWVKGTRISLDSIVYAFRRGASPESIKRSFPLLTLEEVYGAITFYLAHEQEIDAYLRQSEIELEAQADARRAETRSANSELFERLEEARKERETVK